MHKERRRQAPFLCVGEALLTISLTKPSVLHKVQARRAYEKGPFSARQRGLSS
jgi:hypothetical protein